MEGWLVRSMVDRHVEAIRRAVAMYGVEVVVMEETQGWVGEIRGKVSIPIVATLHGPWWVHRMAGSAPMMTSAPVERRAKPKACSGWMA